MAVKKGEDVCAKNPQPSPETKTGDVKCVCKFRESYGITRVREKFDGGGGPLE